MATETINQETQPSTVAAATPSPLTKRNVQTTINYYNDPGDGSPPTPVYVGRATVKNERPMISVPVLVHDITGSEDEFLLSNHGFQLLRHESQEKDFLDEEKIKRDYYPECVELLQNTTNASRIHIFGHQVRRGPSNWHKLGAGNASKKGPLHRAHIDQSYEGAEMELRVAMPEEAEKLMERRWQIINLWRPIHTIHKDPLAVASSPSIPDSDLIAAEIIYPTYKKQSWTIRPPTTESAASEGPEGSRGHRWFFKNEQTPGEVLAIKCFDSCVEGGLARRAPHAAFRDGEFEVEAWAARESIEVRCLVFY